jgi:hypothetical protein
MSNDYKGLRSRAEKVKRKVNEGQNITSEELDTLRRYTQATNGNAANLAAFAIGKRLVKAEGSNGNEDAEYEAATATPYRYSRASSAEAERQH